VQDLLAQTQEHEQEAQRLLELTQEHEQEAARVPDRTASSASNVERQKLSREPLPRVW
jgi:hypothetical protein